MRTHRTRSRARAAEREGVLRAFARHVPFLALSALLHAAIVCLVVLWERHRPPAPAPIVASASDLAPITVRREAPVPPPSRPLEAKPPEPKPPETKAPEAKAPERRTEEKVAARDAPSAAPPPRTAPNTGADRNGLMKQGPIEKPATKKGPDQQAAPHAKPQRYQETAREAPASRPSPPPARSSAKPAGPSLDPRRAGGPPVATVDSYRQSLQRQMAGSPENGGESVPTFTPAPFDRSDLAGLMRFFSMKLIAYDPERQSRRFFLECDLEGQDVKRRTDFEVFAKTMGNRGLRVNGVLPELVEKLVSEHGLPAERIVLNAMFSPDAARYLAWKEVTACKSAGVEPKAVQSCHGSFARTSFGGWVILIDRLSLGDGRELPVTDPEASLVAARGASPSPTPRIEGG